MLYKLDIRLFSLLFKKKKTIRILALVPHFFAVYENLEVSLTYFFLGGGDGKRE